jgi:hypothetical protein
MCRCLWSNLCHKEGTFIKDESVKKRVKDFKERECKTQGGASKTIKYNCLVRDRFKK